MSLLRKSVIAGASGFTVAIFLIIIVVAIYPLQPVPSTNAQSPVAVMVTDPPTLPSGSTALQLTYSGFTITYLGGSGLSSLNVTQSGSLNLESLVGYSQVIGVQPLPVGATIKSVTLDVVSVSITINGTTYPVTPLSKSLTILVPSGQITSGSASGVLVDIHALVEAVPAVSSTGQVTDYFVFVPNAVAVFNPAISKVHLNTRIPVNADDLAEIENRSAASSSGLEITATSLVVSGNTTTFSITLRNTGNENASLFGVTLSGDFISYNYPPVNYTGQGAGFNASSRGADMGASASDSHSHESTLMFRVSGNGTLVLAGPELEDYSPLAGGAVVAPGSSITLHFTGVLGLGQAQNGEDTVNANSSVHIVLDPVSGYSYSTVLLGPFEEMSAGNVTAS
jgi:hypothetical protein